MSRTFKALLASAILASMVIAPAAAQAGDNKTPTGDHCLTIENFGPSSLSATAANGLSVSLFDIEYESSNEPMAFSWTANGEATLYVKAARYITSEDPATFGDYRQGESADDKTHAISHVTFCGPAGGGDDDPTPTTLPCTPDDTGTC